LRSATIDHAGRDQPPPGDARLGPSARQNFVVLRPSAERVTTASCAFSKRRSSAARLAPLENAHHARRGEDLLVAVRIVEERLRALQELPPAATTFDGTTIIAPRGCGNRARETCVRSARAAECCCAERWTSMVVDRVQDQGAPRPVPGGRMASP
jgi:hypothetical protein